MDRHFSESEISAMSRNRVEDKGLRNRLIRLKEEQNFTYDHYAREKKREIEFLKENRKTSGNIRLDFEDTEVSEEMFKSVLLSRRPWSCTPSETTFNVVYREATDPAVLKASYLIREKGKKIIRRASAKSTPSASRSLAVSRQSTRSEPVFQHNRRNLFSASPQRRTLQSAYHKRKNATKEKMETAIDTTPRLRVAHAVTIVWDDDDKVTNSKDIVHDPFNVEKLHANTPNTTAVANHSTIEKHGEDGTEIPTTCAKSDHHLNNDENADVTSHVLREDKNHSTESHVLQDNKNQLAENRIQDDIKVIDVVGTESGDSNETTCIKSNHFVATPNSSERNEKEKMLEQNGNIDDKKHKREKIRKKKRLSIQEPFSSKDREDTVVSTEIVEIPPKEERRASNTIADDSLPPLPNTSVQESSEQLTNGNTIQVQDNVNGTGESTNSSKKEETILERQVSHVGSMDIHEVVDFSDVHPAHNFVLDDNCILYKGKVIRDYVKPHLRYKHDPFAKKSRERLIRKLTGDVAINIEEENSEPIKVHRNYSKGARKRMLKQLVDENNSPCKDQLNNAENDKLEEKIHLFHESINEFIRLKCS